MRLMINAETHPARRPPRGDPPTGHVSQEILEEEGDSLLCPQGVAGGLSELHGASQETQTGAVETGL